MEIFTIGFTQKTAERFFSLIKQSAIDLLIDVRLNNKSQLAGFTRGSDLEFFLKKICDCNYKHVIDCAPDKSLLAAYKRKQNPISWGDYEERYLNLISKRNIVPKFEGICEGAERVCLLCSEAEPDHCHRRLLAEAIAKHYGYPVSHLV